MTLEEEKKLNRKALQPKLRGKLKWYEEEEEGKV